MKNKGIIYVRESTKDQDWKSQLAECRKYCKKNNIEITKEYVDLMSGARNDRKGFLELQDDIADGNFDILVVWELSRTTRDFVTHRLMLDSMNEAGIQLHSLQEGILNNHDDIDKMFGIDLMALFNERERKIVGRRIKYRTKHTTESGLWKGGRLALGYDCTKDKILVPNNEAWIVKEIFDLYIKGETVTEIARRFSFADEKKVNRTLRNPIYTGYLKLNESEAINGKIVIHKNYKLVKGKHEPIISMETFEITKQLLKQRRRAEHKHRYILPSVYCHCGSRMYPSVSKNNKVFYVCSSTGKWIDSEFLENQIFASLRGQLNEFEVLNNLDSDISSSNETKIIAYENEINKLKKQEEKLTNKYLQELISDEIFDTMINNIKENKRKYQSEIEKLSKIPKNEVKIDNFEIFKNYLEKIENESDLDKKRKLLTLIINEIRLVNDFRCVIFTNII